MYAIRSYYASGSPCFRKSFTVPQEPEDAQKPRTIPGEKWEYHGRMGTRRYFATTSKGLEAVLAGEIRSLGGEEITAVTGGVSFSGDTALGYRANLRLRTANRVLLFLSDFAAPTPDALYERNNFV